MKKDALHFIVYLVFIMIGVFNTNTISAADREMSAEELEKWFNSDEDIVDPIKLINEGELVFLKKKPELEPHQARHTITILPGSLKDGWVTLNQCHANLDVMPAAQVVFQGKRVRNLKILSSTNIGKTWIEDKTIQLKNVQKNATVCLEVETKALWKNTDGSYTLKTGPYQRKFLDGYFPMRLLLEVNYPENRLTFKQSTPKIQAGFSVTHDNGIIKVNALFEGLLYTQLLFNKQ